MASYRCQIVDLRDVHTLETQLIQALLRLFQLKATDCHCIKVATMIEGVDIPEVNTVLFLRPTESATVFIQQLGRGLRLSKGKDCLTVLDFVGQADRHYNYSMKFRALTGRRRKSVQSNADYISHSGEMPVSFNWHLHSPIPADLLPDANKTIAM